MALPISVVIPTMNRPKSFERTICLFSEGLEVPSQIVVVDQSETPEVRERNKDAISRLKNEIKHTDYIHQQVPSSTKARNIGLSSVKNDIVIFADDDIDVNTDTVSNVFTIMADPNVAMVAGMDELTPHSSKKIGYFFGTKSYRKRKIGHVTKSMLGRYPDNVKEQTETQWAQGFFFVVRKSLLDKWHIRWDENLTSYAYAEDLDFSFNYYKHAKNEGLRCVIDPSVTVKHLATLEYRIPSAKAIYMYIINRAYLSSKHKMGFRGKVASAWCNFWRLVQAIISGRNAIYYLMAIIASYKFRKQIRVGRLDYDKLLKIQPYNHNGVNGGS